MTSTAETGMFDPSAFGDLPGISELRGTAEAASGDFDMEGVKSSVEGLASEAMEAVSDPLGWLVSNGLDFLMEFVQPLEDMVQLVSGDSESLTQASEEFRGVQDQLKQLSEELTSDMDDSLKDWNGQAAQAVRTKLAEFADGIENTGKQAHNLAELLQASATLAQSAEDVIKGILSDFISWLIMTWIPALASAGPTFGGSTAAAGAATGVEATVTTTKAVSRVEKVIEILDQIMTALDQIKALLDTTRAFSAYQEIKSGDSSGNGLADASQQVEDTKSDVEDAKDELESETEEQESSDSTNGDSSTPSSSDTGQDADSADAGTSIDPKETAKAGASNVADHYAEGASTAADSLEDQAADGGFSDVPSDKTMSGQLDV